MSIRCMLDSPNALAQAALSTLILWTAKIVSNSLISLSGVQDMIFRPDGIVFGAELSSQ